MIDNILPLLCEQAMLSYKIYLVMAAGISMDMVSLKWPDIAKASINGESDLVRNDLLWMIYEPIRIIFNATLERAVQVIGKVPAKYANQSQDTWKLLSYGEVILVRDTTVQRIDELLDLIHVMTNVSYPKLGQYLEVSCK